MKDWQPALVLASLLLGSGVLLRCRRTIWETTLISAWWWTWAAVISVASLEILASRMSDEPLPYWIAGLRLIAGGLTLCPALSLMGAKRPQELAWNWVVLALWGLLVLPVAVSLYRPTSTPLAAYGPLAYFVWVLIALGFVNLIPTRFWPAAFMLAAGQALYLSEHLPLLPALGPWHINAGLALLTGSLLLSALLADRVTDKDFALDRVWIDFRDTFGLFWSLRVQERINDAATKLDWPVRLTWSGFVNRADGTAVRDWPQDVERAIRQTMRGLLRRFVSPQWLQARWGDE